jgi:hypothetical protein
MRLAGTDAVSCVALTKVVVRAVVFSDTVAPLRKLAPFTVNVIAGPPATTVEGEIVVIAGVGTVMVRLTAFEGVPPVFVTVTDAVPALVIELAGTDAVS